MSHVQDSGFIATPAGFNPPFPSLSDCNHVQPGGCFPNSKRFSPGFVQSLAADCHKRPGKCSLTCHALRLKPGPIGKRGWARGLILKPASDQCQWGMSACHNSVGCLICFQETPLAGENRWNAFAFGFAFIYAINWKNYVSFGLWNQNGGQLIEVYWSSLLF